MKSTVGNKNGISLVDSVVLVTGASRKRGIGQALVHEAINRGAKKVYATARKLSQLEDLVAECNGKVVPLELDVTNSENIDKIAKEASDVQVLINNAGLAGLSGCTDNLDLKLARQEMDVNFFAPLEIISKFSPHLIKNENSAVVNVVSIAGLYPTPILVSYSASKAALYSLTQAVRIEMSQHHVPVFGVYPGPIDTDMADAVDVAKETPADLAIRVFDGMEKGQLDITTDRLSDKFVNFLKVDMDAVLALKEEFEKAGQN